MSTRPDSIIFRYWHWFYPFPILVRIVFLYYPGFYFFLVLTLILPFSQTRQDSLSIVARILPFLGTRLDYTIFRYAHWFYHFPDTRPHSTNFRYSHWFYPLPKLFETVFKSMPGFYLFPVLDRMLPFFGTDTDSTLFPKLMRTIFQ